MNCEHFTPQEGRCRKKARVAVTYVIDGGSVYGPSNRQTHRCWPHYLKLENKARNPGATFRIREAKIIE